MFYEFKKKNQEFKMIKRTKQECEACKYKLSFQSVCGMDFVICGYGKGSLDGSYRGYYKFFDGLVTCPQTITGTLSPENAEKKD